MSEQERWDVDRYRRELKLPPRGRVDQVSFAQAAGQTAEIFYDHGLVNGMRVVSVPPQAMGKAHHRLGRLAPDEMNKTEARFHREWILPRIASGEILWCEFGAIKLRIGGAKRCFLTVDFPCKMADGSFLFIDVKGAKAIVEEDAKVKMKVAAATYPIRFQMAFPRPSKLGGGWLFQEVS